MKKAVIAGVLAACMLFACVKVLGQSSDLQIPSTEPQNQGFSATPTRIIIPAAGISLPVIHAKVAFNTWEVSLEGASFGDGTSLPRNTGNTVIFSHAIPTLFGDLPKVKKGDVIHVFTDNDWFTYRVTQRFVVGPEKTDIISSGDNKELTLYTCTGDDYKERFIIKAMLIPATKAL